MITFEVVCGNMIRPTIEKAITIAKACEETVHFNFNGVPIYITSEALINRVEDYYTLYNLYGRK